MKQKKNAKENKKGEKKAVLYEAIKDGSKRGLLADAIYEHVLSVVPDAGGKAIVKTALLALSDPEITDRSALDAIYDLVIKHRLAEVTVTDVAEAADEMSHNKKGPPVASKKKPSKKAPKTA